MTTNEARSPNAAVADGVMSNIRGCTSAQRFIFDIRHGCAPADALHEALEQERATGDADRLRGFVREVQKTLERSA